MEILGRYKVRDGTNEKVIHAPANVWGEWILTMNDNGTFTYSPAEGQIISPSTKTQWIVTTPELEDAVTFTNEKAAEEYKAMMEKNQGKVFRMKKVFPSNGIRTLGEAVY